MGLIQKMLRYFEGLTDYPIAPLNVSVRPTERAKIAADLGRIFAQQSRTTHYVDVGAIVPLKPGQRYTRPPSPTPINPDMGEGRYQDALRRMRGRIADGVKLTGEDSNTIGDKYTHCSWGMCTDDPEQWPDPDDHTWPEWFKDSGRVAPRTAPGGCPMDTRTGTSQESAWGCFHHCRYFRAHLGDTGHREFPNRSTVIGLYDLQIYRRTKEHGFKTKEDDEV